MIQQKWAVIVPTYNNYKTLKRVLDSILEHTTNIIVVNDGCTDSTPEILNNYPQLVVVQHLKNLGKGLALRNGFKKAQELGYDFVITIDSDGQHFAKDIPLFVAEYQNNGPALLIGSRNMAQEGVPKKSSFGNKFSNFWFWFETGIKLEDTQSGFRLYPLPLLPQKYFTNKFEFEIEVIVRAAWSGVVVQNIPISVLYNPAERVSHFRPFKDFTRISILNTVLVIIALAYIKPRDFFLKLKKKGFKAFFFDDVLKSSDPPLKKAFSIALGIFIGIAPLWGFHTVLVLGLSTALKLNRTIAYIASNISFPPCIPFIIYGSLLIGNAILPSAHPIVLTKMITFAAIQSNLEQYILGSFILAACAAVVLGLFSYWFFVILSLLKNKK